MQNTNLHNFHLYRSEHFFPYFMGQKCPHPSPGGQTVILHTLPLNYVVIILSQNLSILHAPEEMF